MSFRSKVLGKRLTSSDGAKEKLSAVAGIPVLGLDALASTGYGPEAALTALLPLGAVGHKYFLVITCAIVALLVLLYFSYRQTAEAYPQGGGAYNVVRDNFGHRWAALAAVCLLLDYLLNVAVAISAGVGAVVSAVPALHSYTLPLCLGVLGTLMIVNLRGVRETGMVFVVPVFAFIGCMTAVLGLGVIRAALAGGHPPPVDPLPPLPPATRPVSAWILLSAFANGCTAMTGVEAVSNGVPLFRKPTVVRAHRTLTAIAVILGVFLIALGYVCPAYGIGAMKQEQPGYQTVLSQVVQAVVGRGVFYYIALGTIFIVLTYSAQTSFADFPRVCRFLSEDCFLPSGFANRGRRLVYSTGILVLAAFSGMLLIIFGGITESLIPLFAVGAFGAFLSSQTGMTRHWLRVRGRHWRKKFILNGLGALGSLAALGVLVIAKFREGAWITMLVVPAMYILLRWIRRYYVRLGREVDRPVELEVCRTRPPIFVLPISGWNRATEKALRFALGMSREIIAVHVATEREDTARLRTLWAKEVEEPAREAHIDSLRLEILPSPFRLLHEPILEFIQKLKDENPDRKVAIVIPEVVSKRWYHFLLNNQHPNGLKLRLYLGGDERTVVINVPWYVN